MTKCEGCEGTGITGFTLLNNKAVRCELCKGTGKIRKVPKAFRADFGQQKYKPLGGAVIPIKNE